MIPGYQIIEDPISPGNWIIQEKSPEEKTWRTVQNSGPYKNKANARAGLSRVLAKARKSENADLVRQVMSKPW